MSSKGSTPTLESPNSSFRERRNSTSSTSSSSPFLNNSYRSHTSPLTPRGGGNMPGIQLEEISSSTSNLNPAGSTQNNNNNDNDTNNNNIYRKLKNKLFNRDNFKGHARTVYIGNEEQNKTSKFCNNVVTTSKYSIITFLPKNLIEQFSRLANFYFLIISAIQIIPGISPTGQFTTLGPLLVVLAITAIKEAYEDFRRHQQDDRVNYSRTEILVGNKFKEIYWRDLKVGDIVRVSNRQYIPADIVVLATSEPQSICYVETANLDGETNLKLKQALPETVGLIDEDTLNSSTLNENTPSLTDFQTYIECEHPNNRLYTFIGSLYSGGKGHPLSPKQVLLRGAMLRNTKWVYGSVIYTGRDTKLMRNSNDTPSKRSGVERKTNIFIFTIFIFQILLCIGCAIANTSWTAENKTAWYLMWDISASKGGALSFLTFLILYNNLIPISLYVSMEFVKVFQAMFINNDIQMYYADNDTPALARTSNLNEELGQIEYIFSDKTGTLTQNKMEFKKCSIAGLSYGNGSGELTDATIGMMMREGKNGQQQQPDEKSINNNNADLEAAAASRTSSNSSINNDSSTNSSNSSLGGVNHNNSNNNNSNCNIPNSKSTTGGGGPIPYHVELKKQLSSADPYRVQAIREFFHVLAVCHTVIPEEENGKIYYQASSPDESALVNASKLVGFDFIRRNTKSVTIVNDVGEEMEFQILNVLEFNSTRKRMSVIVRHPDGRLLLYTKGADTAIFERLAPNQQHADATITHLQEFATEGLRTLCVAYRELEPAVYEAWAADYYTASNTIVGREAALDRMAEAIERRLLLLGATAIEDRLQVVVPETISKLRSAGIKVWVLTGDKQETAINIGFACQLLTTQMELMVVNETTPENTSLELTRLWDEYNNVASSINRKNMALIVDGSTLVFILESKEMSLALLRIACLCKAVIACRVSPAQKAQIVGLVRDNIRVTTLAIGDGANDVSMIQRAHVGIGISGEEGLQAARCSDYSIAQFRFLARLLLIHGRYSYRRISKLIVYCFYKNITLYITQFWFTIFNGWSGQTFYERFTLTAYNIAWTFFSIIVFGILDKDVSEAAVMENPQLYQTGPRNYYFNLRVFWGWAVNGLFHSLLLFIFPTFIFSHGLAYESGRVIDLFSVGTVAYTCIVITVNLKLALEIRYWTWINHLTVWGSIGLYILWLLVFGKFWEIESLDVGVDLFDIVYRIGQSSLFYLSIICVPVICLWRDFTWKYLLRTNIPRSYHIVQELHQKKPKQKSQQNTNPKKLYTGYSFSQEPGQADVINKKYSQ
ncbi:P-type ATPase [Heterostelium album PN500]|uniref:Phospholipid-transporting ATPase n=1 Tax=Heterostelium pallidum (strain ATCC 26659 / Pp 5 / PN500) TaxID=670386 RepID=D3BVP5_HETP5|nr:P-type ATPase [Heterostelium album PN500]EFA74548.1 P-type ATPase [Heterostelium album PN500]|eukprot:XP_020426682.1 P-type ATPase [Heterostelium album PN500]